MNYLQPPTQFTLIAVPYGQLSCQNLTKKNFAFCRRVVDQVFDYKIMLRVEMVKILIVHPFRYKNQLHQNTPNLE